MQVQIQNQHGVLSRTCEISKVVEARDYAFLTLSQQTDGRWSLMVGTNLADSKTLSAIKIRDRVGSRAAALFIHRHGDEAETYKYNVLINYVDERLPYLHFDFSAGDLHLTMYVSDSLMDRSEWPANLTFTEI